MSHDQVIQWTKAKGCVHSDSVLCLGKMNESKNAILRCEGHVEEFQMSPSYRELQGISGEAIELEWNIFPVFSSLQQPEQDKRNLSESFLVVRPQVSLC